MSNPDDSIKVVSIRGGNVVITDTTMAKVIEPAKKPTGKY